MQIWGFPGGSVVKNPPTNVGDMGSIPGLGRPHMLQGNKAHAPQLLSLCSRAHKQKLLKAAHPGAGAPQQEKPLQLEACVLQLERSPCSPQLEEAHAATKTKHSQKYIFF